jgi:REP element-mobilizing transposase RayT
MPAKNLRRINEDGIYLHIYNQGVGKGIIFHDQEDYQIFLEYIKDYLSPPKDQNSLKQVFEVHGRTFRGTPHLPKNYFNQVELVAFSLYSDHFHLVLQQKAQGSVQKFIRSLCTRYSIYFNKKHHRSGTLFAGPYKSVVLEPNQLASLSSYLHQNKQSSVPFYLGERQEGWIHSEAVLASFGYSFEGYNQFLQSKDINIPTNISIDNTDTHLERSIPPKKELEPSVETHRRLPEFFIASTLIFLLLLGVSLKNIITVSAAKSVSSPPNSAVLSETKQNPPLEATTSAQVLASDSAKPKESVVVKLDNPSAVVNVRQNPSPTSKKLQPAKNGEKFELISETSDWFEIKTASGSGFISNKYAQKEINE